MSAINYLTDIIERKKAEVEKLPLYPIVPDCTQDFSFLSRRPILVAEIKAKSPSQGRIADDFNPLSQANAYINGGADAISVLTDKDGFGGSFEILCAIRKETDKPLLCKDFIIDERQIDHARMHGADMALLIIKALPNNRLIELKDYIESKGMKALIEIQDEGELAIAQDMSADFILVNSRNLETFETDITPAQKLTQQASIFSTALFGSAIETAEQAQEIIKKGAHGCLIGTALMKSENPTRFLEQCRL